MGLLLSVLVVCVGVLEVLACVRHFQDGYLPLWTPHCAVTSGYTATYERWRKEPSDGYDFRPFDDVNDAFNRSENHLLQTSSNVQNGSAGKQIEKTGENNCPSAYQQSKSDSGNGFSPSISGCKTEVPCSGNKPDIMASSLDCDKGDAGVVASGSTDVIPDIPHAEYGKKSQDVCTAGRTCGLQSEKHPVNISAQYGVLISRTEAESPAPSQLNSILEGTVSHDTGIEKRPVSTKDIDVHNEVSVVYTGSELQTSPWESATDRHLEGVSSDDILSGKYLTRHTFGTEPELEIPSSDLYSNKVSDTRSTVGQPGGQVPSPEGKPNIPLSDFTTNTCSSTVSEVDQIPATEIESQIPSPDFTIEKSLSTTGERENQASSIRNETNILSSCLQMQDDKSDFGVTAWEPPDTIQETFDKHKDGLSQDECTIPTSLNSEQRHQNYFVPNSVSEETSIATVESSTHHSVSFTQDAVEPERTGIVSEKPFSSPEPHADRKELPASSIHVECEQFLSAESGGQRTGTDINEGMEALNSQAEISVSAHNAGNATDIHLGSERLKQEDVQFVTVGEHPVPETSVDVEEDRTGAQHDVLESLIRREASSPRLQNEKEINVASDDARQDVSESRLDSQTTVTDPVSSRDDSTPYEDDSGFPGSGSLTKPSQESFDLRTSSITSVTPLTIDTSVQSSLSPSPLTIDTSFETSASVTPLPTDHQPSLSPPKLPSTPRKSKADISWPTFFPGAPVIKRPSVTFATPESVFTNEDEELLRQFIQEASTGSSRTKIPNDTSTATESESTTASTSEGELSGSPGTPERSDSLEEPVPVVFREKSPSGIVSGNDFSRKELKLQRRKSYKQKRYSSAIEIRAQDEETEDRSFSENHPELTRASSVKEPKKRYKKLARSSSFEDAVLRDIKPEGEGETGLTNTTGGITDVSILEVRETGSEETQQDEQEDFGGFAGETEGSIDITDSQTIRTERNEPKLNESKSQQKNMAEKREGTEGQKEEETRDDEGDNTVSEEQSSSQKKSPPKEAFWLIFSGEYTKAMSKDWHSGHFCCWQCDESLTGQRYVLRDDHPYCIKCYESVFANVCEECNKTIGIDSKDLSYKDKHWHEACFLCNKCRVSLVDKQFGSKADKIYCGNCYDAQFASRCDGCGEIFRAGTKKMEYKTRQWHEKCFCCCVCKTAIGTKSFIPREQEIYCATCYEEKFATRCVKCNKIITSGGVTYKNEPWHRECFTCTNCNTSLAGQRFTSRDEKPYCAECFGELFAKRCTACSKPITGIGGTRFISFEDRHWHNDCFICATCKTSLVGRGFITDADDIICPECAKQKLM